MESDNRYVGGPGCITGEYLKCLRSGVNRKLTAENGPGKTVKSTKNLIWPLFSCNGEKSFGTAREMRGFCNLPRLWFWILSFQMFGDFFRVFFFFFCGS